MQIGSKAIGKRPVDWIERAGEALQLGPVACSDSRARAWRSGPQIPGETGDKGHDGRFEHHFGADFAGIIRSAGRFCRSRRPAPAVHSPAVFA